jgi:sulfate adenylyltransferase subunit 2
MTPRAARVFDHLDMLESEAIHVIREIVAERERPVLVGDATCTGCVVSDARTIEAVIAEVISSTRTERGVGRADDLSSAAAMEDRKREGYF